jgi:hypothetical protein
MPTRETLEAELTRLEAVLSGGVSRISKGDRTAEYDLDQVRRRRDEIRAQLNRTSAARPVRRVYVRSC